MNLSSIYKKARKSIIQADVKSEPTTEELIERGFAPQNNRIDILLINPPSSISERYGKENMDEIGGDLIPLGIAAYVREKGYGVGVLDCPTLRIDNQKVYEIILQKDPAIIGFSTTTYSLSRAVELAKNIETKRKNRDFEKMKQVAKWTKEVGIEVRGSFLIGLPGETPELAKKTVQNAIDLDPDYAQFTLVCPYPGTALAKEIEEGKWGKFISRDLEEYQCWNVTWLPFGYKSIQELKDMERYAFRKFYLRPSYIFKRIMKIRSFEDIKRYFKGGKALVRAFL
jgi:hypothetical protein